MSSCGMTALHCTCAQATYIIMLNVHTDSLCRDEMDTHIAVCLASADFRVNEYHCTSL